jgi:hypothetical protein
MESDIEVILDIAKEYYDWQFSHPIDVLCALYEYFTYIAPVDKIIEEIELGLREAKSLRGLSMANLKGGKIEARIGSKNFR